MTTILQIGCGGLGQLIVQACLQDGHTLTVVRKSAQLAPLPARTLQMDVLDTVQSQALSNHAPEILIYCLSATESSDESYRLHYVQGLQNVLANLNQTQLKHVFFISSTRVYGEQNGEIVDEDTPAKPTDCGGALLLQAEQLLASLNCGHTALRLSGIYGPKRLYLLRMAQNPEKWPTQHLWTNRIHEADASAFVAHLIRLKMQGQALHAHYIVTDNQPVMQHEVLQSIAQQQAWPLPPTPNLNQQAGKRLLNRGLISSGYQLKYPTYRDGYAQVLGANNS